MVDYNKVLEHAHMLTERFPDRFAGTENARLAAEYIHGACTEAGVKCELVEFDMYTSIPHSSTVRIYGGGGEVEVESVPFANSPSTAGAEVRGELVFVGPGSEADFARASVVGKIVLAESSYNPPRQEKIRLAEAAGAAGILLAHWGDADSPLMVRGNAKGVWGNPSVESVQRLPSIPAVGISRRSGGELRELLYQGPVEIGLNTSTEQSWGQSSIPLVHVPGSATDEFVIVGGHYDSWAGGATDNAVGNGFLIELARALGNREEKLRRSVWFAFWPGHETTTMSGSTWFVDHYWDELRRGCVAYINVDTLGLTGSNPFLAHSSPVLRAFARRVAEQLLEEEIIVAPLARTGDQSFFGVGIPSLYGRTTFDEATLKASHGATLGWWNHSHPSQDNMDKVDRAMVEKAGVVIESWVEALVASPTHPFVLGDVATDLVARLEELSERAPETLRLGAVLASAQEFRAIATEVDGISTILEQEETDAESGSGDFEKLNRRLRRVLQILTPVLHSVAGRYAQDSYGLTALKSLIPGLYLLESGSASSGDLSLSGPVVTSLRRERNRVIDALDEAIREAKNLLREYRG